MPISGQYYGGKRRFYFSRAPETATTAGWAVTPATLAGVLNIMNGSPMLGPPKYRMLDNANSAQGQGMLPTSITKGPHDNVKTLKFWLTPEAVGRFVSSCLGTDTKSAYGTGYQHAMLYSDSPIPFTVEEHLQGTTDATNAWKFTGVWCRSWEISVTRGAPYAELNVELVGSKYYGAGADQTTLDITNKATSWPTEPGIVPMKVGLWLAATTGSNHTTAYDGAITTPQAAGAGVIPEDLASEINVGQLCQSFSLKYDTGVNVDDLYQAGMSSAAGAFRGKPTSVSSAITLTLNFDVNATSDDLLFYNLNFADASQQSYTAQLSGIMDSVVGGAGYYGGLSVVVGAMTVQPSDPSGDLGPMTSTVTLTAIQPAAAEEFIRVFSWDAINQDYA